MNLDWLKTIKHVMRDERVPMRRIHDVFMNLKPNQPVRILVIGKTVPHTILSYKLFFHFFLKTNWKLVKTVSF